MIKREYELSNEALQEIGRFVPKRQMEVKPECVQFLVFVDITVRDTLEHVLEF